MPRAAQRASGLFGSCRAVAWAPSGELAVGSDRLVTRFGDGRFGQPVALGTAETRHSGNVTALAWNAASSLVADASDAGTIDLWSVASPSAARAVLVGHAGAVPRRCVHRGRPAGHQRR